MAADVAQPDEAPTLTPTQRLHLEVHGYVVLECVLSESEVAALRDKVYELEEDFHSDGPVKAAAQNETPWFGGTQSPGWDSQARKHFYLGQTRDYFRVDNLPHLAPCFLDYVTHPVITGAARDAVGGAIRLEQSDAHLSRLKNSGEPVYDWHRGGSNQAATQYHSLYHYPFVKALTNLTDLGADDGGTSVIVGSHKLDDDAVPAVIAAATEGPPGALVHQVVAPAGSMLLFFESLLHSPGNNRSGRDRMFIVGGFTTTIHQPCEGYWPALSLRDQVDAETWTLLEGTWGYRWTSQARPLSAFASG